MRTFIILAVLLLFFIRGGIHLLHLRQPSQRGRATWIPNVSRLAPTVLPDGNTKHHRANTRKQLGAHLTAQRGRHVAGKQAHVDACAVRLALAVAGGGANGQPGLWAG